ncbi:hypothetical protein KR054_009584 [Drosophila jambulina]|nr:hypothetical protein KR054_009584 [Drosophila jambulina]
MNDSKKPDLLSLEPREALVFEGPFNRSVCKSLTLGNPSKKQTVAFKLKTTSPRMFFVRPNIGTVGPDAKITVDIFMQPISPDAGQKQHKFLVQAALVSGSDIDLLKFWKEQKSADIWEAKIKCALVQRKQSEEQMREAGGGAITPDPKPDGEIEFDAEEVSEPVAQLLKQVSMLEDERLSLKKEINILQDQTVVHQAKPLGKDFFMVASCIFTIVAAILGAYFGKKYL